MDTEALRQRFPNGHGRFTQYSLTGLTDPAMTARIPNQIQRYFVEETRLGIPVALQTENLCGWPGAGGTLFPAQINLASTWQPELTREMSRVIGQESRAVGANSAMSPVIDVSRDPRWGRTYETYGEDPYLVSRMGVAYVKGMQADKTDGVACIAKHFLGYAETQGGLNCAAARIGDRELYETFATPFEAADKEAQVSAMMANYGEIDGIPVGANPRIARTLLRDTMGFDGVLTSDGAAIMKMWNFYHIADTYQQAGELALKGGLGTEIPVGASFAQLPQAVRAGRVDEALLDEAVRRVRRARWGIQKHTIKEETAVKKQSEATTLQSWWFATGNIANNLIFMFITMFMMYFFTNVMGLDPVVAGTIFMVARLVDAFTDPIMGMIIDRTNFKHFGKYRGFIHFGAPLLGVVVVVLFTVPNLPMSGKILYAYITYILYSLAWTVVQVPQLTIPILMSNNVARRTKIQAIFQGVGSIGVGSIGVGVTSGLAMAVVNANGGMNDPHAWQVTAIVFAVLATIGFALSTLAVRNLDTYDPNAKARAAQRREQQKAQQLPLRQRMAFITKNVALFALLIGFGTDMFANQINSQTQTYFWVYNMNGRTDLLDVASYTRVKTGVDAAGLMASSFTFANKLCQAVASFVAGWLLKVIAFDATLAMQTQSTMDKLLLMRCLFPIAAYAITLVAMRFYPIDKQGEADLQVALDKLKKQEAAETV